MIRKILHSKKGEGYVDMCVGVVVFVMILVIAINIFSFITLRIEMDQIADIMARIAAAPEDADALLRELRGAVPSAQRIGVVEAYNGGPRISLR